MRYKKVGCLQFLCLVLLVHAQEPHEHEHEVKNLQRRGVVENLGEGLKLAGQMFGINTAADVANLVAMAFAKKKPDFLSIFQQKQTSAADSESEATQKDYTNSQEQQQQQQQQQQEKGESAEESSKRIKQFDFSTSRFVAGVLRMVGFDATKLGALAINALVMIAEVIGNAFTSPTRNRSSPPPTPFGHSDEGVPDALRNGEREAHQPRALRDGTPIDWYLENPDEGMRRTLDDALDSELTERIAEMIANVEKQNGGQGGCLKMLMCKSSPIIWGMQRSLSERVTGKATKNAKEAETQSNERAQGNKIFSSEVFFTHFPTLQEFREHSAVCNERFRDECNLKEDMDKLMKDMGSSKRKEDK